MANLEIVVDGDGHVFEDQEGIRRHMRGSIANSHTVKMLGIFPALDHLHHGLNTIPPGAFGRGKDGVWRDPGPSGWVDFLDKAGIETTVLYPTAGLAYGRIVDVDYAIEVCRGYNDWLTTTYSQVNSRFKGMALIPMQEPEAAVEELHRAVVELGMTGAMLPSTGLPTHLGAKAYWPVYEEAQRLGCSLAVHGGAHQDLGMNSLNVFAAVHALGHPLGIMIGLAGMVFNGVFDKFPTLKVAYLEGGVGWFLMALERFAGSHWAFTPVDPRGELVQLAEGQTLDDYVIDLCKKGRITIGVEGDEPLLAKGVQMVGREAFMYSSDFPHEVNLESIRHEIEELLEIEDLTSEDKEAILHKNALSFYNLDRPAT